MDNSIQVGTRVLVDNGGESLKGTIVLLTGNMALVSFDEARAWMHDAGHMLPKENGWWAPIDDLTVITLEESIDLNELL